MTSYSVHLSDEAWQEIERRIRYIANELNAPINAGKWSRRLLNEVETLEVMPRRPTLDDVQTRAHGQDVYRLVFEGHYHVFYVIDDASQRVDLMAFRYGGS